MMGKEGESGRVRARYRVKKVLDVLLFWIDRYPRDGMVWYTFLDFSPGKYIHGGKSLFLSLYTFLALSLPPLSLSGMGIRESGIEYNSPYRYLRYSVDVYKSKAREKGEGKEGDRHSTAVCRCRPPRPGTLGKFCLHTFAGTKQKKPTYLSHLPLTVDG